MILCCAAVSASAQQGTLLISELLYQPLSHEAEYVELYNNGDLPLELADYHIVRWIGDVAASFSFLLSTGWGDFHAVYKAHRAFFRMLPESRRKRRSNPPSGIITCMYPGRIVFDYFLFRKKTFSKLKKF